MNAPTLRPIVPCCVVGLFGWMFSDALFGGGMFCFRDAAHYYYPLYKFVAEQWAAGHVPLWNPHENLGQPLAGNPTASVFYPGKLVFALPLSYAWAYKLYIMGHVLLAAFAAHRLARHLGASVEAAGCCAISYAFSGNVLFQYANVVFLVGAAWLPLALLTADRTLLQRSARWAVALGAVLAMMILGGDPQMAYNAGLLAALYALLLWLEDIRCKAATRDRGKHPAVNGGGFARCKLRPVLLALAAAIGFVLAAVQILPSVEFAHRSTRQPAPIADRLLGRLEPGTHHEHTYQFSVAPWRLAEYVWPNVAGRRFPVHRRWLEVIPAEGRIWTPSLYMGILPLLLALSAMRLCRGDARTRWLSWATVLSAAASFGWYALGWLALEMHVDAGVGAPFGGLYWLITLALPGYGRFRYPAKLLVVAALGLSVLAARGWDQAAAGSSDRVRRWLLAVGGLSMLLAIVALGVRPFWAGWLRGVEADMVFGPLDTAGAFHDLLAALLQTALLCGAFWWLLRKRGRATFSQSSRGQAASNAAAKKLHVPFVMLVLVAVDLAVANRWMIVCAPAGLWREESELAAAIKQREQARSSTPEATDRAPREMTHEEPLGVSPPCRVHRHSIWMPSAWRSTSSPGRLADAVRWDRDTLWPKYNLADRIAVTEVYGAMMLADYKRFLSERRVKKGRTAFLLPRGGDKATRITKKKEPVPVLLAEYVILPGDKALPGGTRIDVDTEDVSLWHNPRYLDRAWIAGDCNTEQPRGLRGESCRVVYYDPLHVEIEAELVESGVVVLCEQFYPGWKLEVDGRPAPVLRVNNVMRGVRLPAGKHILIYRCRPVSFFWGAITSTLGWLALLAWAVKTQRT